MIRDTYHKDRVNTLFTLPLLHHESLCFRALLRLFAEHFRRMPFVAQVRVLCVSCAYVFALWRRWLATDERMQVWIDALAPDRRDKRGVTAEMSDRQ
jgi:hypothetical protein